MANYGGYTGKVLRVDLTRRRIGVEETDWNTADLLVGGRGYAAKVLFDEVPAGVDPLGPDNKLIYATGPLTATLVPGSGRHVMVTKSPETGLFLDSYAGGHFAAEMKLAGYDFVIIEGRADRPSYLSIHDGHVEIRDGAHLWGMKAWDAETRLKREVGDEKARVSLIGPAGERLSNLAIVQNDYYHQCARGGIGAVMGSKNLKAVVVRGSQAIRVARPKEMMDWLSQIEAGVQGNMLTTVIADRMKMGTPLTSNMTNQIGILPTKNFLYGEYEGASRIDGYAFRKQVTADVACYCCNLGCAKMAKATSKDYHRDAIGGPEYETVALFGSNCEIDSLDVVIHANALCDSLGLDTVGAGNVIAWAMECFERGILTEKDTGGLDLRFGNAQAVFTMIEMIARREGLGDLLANGVRIAAKEVGRGSEEFAMHVKGLEYPAYRPGPVSPAFGLVYATTERGACHRRAWPTLAEQATLEPFTTDGRAALVKKLYNQRIPWHCALTCDVVVVLYGTFDRMGHADAAAVISAVTGRDTTEGDMEALCERVATLIRAYNVREGATSADDTLAPRSFAPDIRGPAEGKTLTREMLDVMLREYYALRGWTSEGVPPRGLLIELGLPDVATALDGRGDRIEEIRAR